MGHSRRPEELASLNVIKMLTAAQAVPMTVVDTTAHPAILGYTCAKSGKGVGPHLYKDCVFMGDHDAILRMHSAGSLTGKLGSTPTLTTGVFEGSCRSERFSWGRSQDGRAVSRIALHAASLSAASCAARCAASCAAGSGASCAVHSRLRGKYPCDQLCSQLCRQLRSQLQNDYCEGLIHFGN